MEKKGTLILNMIIGDFEPINVVERCISSVKDYVDGYYITVTYTDKKPNTKHPLIKLLKKYNAKISYFKWTDVFAEARQYALDQVPQSKDIFIIWLDADDVVKNAENIPNIVSEMVEYEQSAVYLNYLYNVILDENGDIDDILVEHKRERIIRNDGTWKWVGDLHEVLIEQRQENIIKIMRNEVSVVHLSDNGRSEVALERNIRILEKSLNKQNEKDPRTLVYLAKAYLDKGRMQEGENRDFYFGIALKLFHKYLNGSGEIGSSDYAAPSGWREERGTAWGHVAEIAVMSQNFPIAIQAYKSAIDEAYEFPNYYVDLAMCYVATGDYKQAKHWLRLATSVPAPKTTIVTFPRELKLRSMQVALEIAIHEKEIEKALNLAKDLQKMAPTDKTISDNIVKLEELKEFNSACQSVVFLGKYLEARGENDKLAHLVQSMPQDMLLEKFASEMRHKFMPAKIWADNEIAILCGPSFEKWTPKSLKTGIGGSEEAVIRLSKELTDLGWKVTVYADPREDAGVFDGVEYKQWYDINYKDSFNVLILWRSIGFIDINPKSKFTMLWLHDMPNNPEFTQERIDKIDKIAVLSEYHRDQLRLNKGNNIFEKMPTDKIFLTTNGVSDIFIKGWKGSPTRMIYSSSPDRGLVYLLKNWNKIIEEVPEAELDIFYGFDVFDAIHKNNPAMKEWKNKIIELMKQKGITYHGRVGHDALHYEMSKSGIWAYPTDFTEISCITAMKAQICGAIPVVTNYAALQETVKNGIKVDVDITTEEGQEEYIKALIDILKDPEKQKDIRTGMMDWAKTYFEWSNVAKTWSEMLKIYLQKPEKIYKLPEKKEVIENAV